MRYKTKILISASMHENLSLNISMYRRMRDLNQLEIFL